MQYQPAHDSGLGYVRRPLAGLIPGHCDGQEDFRIKEDRDTT
jgi:hypothetical protein